MSSMETTSEIRMDSESLYREEVFSDNRIGTIRAMQPVTPQGQVDQTRRVRYFGSAQIMTPAGPLPVSFEIEADDLLSAVDGFGPAAQEAIESTMEELKELQRQRASSIVVPKGGMDPSSLGGGGGIQMP